MIVYKQRDIDVIQIKEKVIENLSKVVWTCTKKTIGKH